VVAPIQTFHRWDTGGTAWISLVRTKPRTVAFSLSRWPYLRIGVRCYMRSTFDRSGGNDNADAAHFIRQVDDTHNVALDELGPGILWFARYNHWHGSPWQYLVDGHETIVSETSTADPLHPAKDSVIEPKELFRRDLNFTWSQTKGADLSWTPVPFKDSLRIAYGRAHYGTGYFVLWKVLPGYEYLSRPVETWGSDGSASGTPYISAVRGTGRTRVPAAP